MRTLNDVLVDVAAVQSRLNELNAEMMALAEAGKPKPLPCRHPGCHAPPIFCPITDSWWCKCGQSGQRDDEDASKWNAQNRVTKLPFEKGITYVVRDGKVWPVLCFRQPVPGDVFMSVDLKVLRDFDAPKDHLVRLPARPILGSPIELGAE